MRFVVTMTNTNQQPGPPNPKLMNELMKFTEEMTRAGVVLATGGLAPRATRIHASGGKLDNIDGPFAETKEMIAGWALLQARSKEEAIAHTARFMKIHQDILGPSWEGVAEVRQLFGPEDGPPK
jgi:hypothetical protein